MEIFKKISLVMAEIDFVAKDQVNKSQGFKFRGIDDVYNAVHAPMAKHGIFTTSEIVAVTISEKISGAGTALMACRLDVKYTFHAEDGSSVATNAIGYSLDSGDKAYNKSLAIAHKYALIQIFCIPTEDPDADAEVHSVKPAAAPAAPAASYAAAAQKPWEPPADGGTKPVAGEGPITEPQINAIGKMANNCHLTDEQFSGILGANSVEKLSDLSKKQASVIIGDLAKMLDAKKGGK